MPRPTTASGFGRVRIRKRDRFWCARWTDGSDRHEVSLKVTNKEVAEGKAREINDALEAGQRWVPGRDRSLITFEQAVDEYLEKGSRWSQNTRRGTRSIVRQLKAEFGDRPVAQIRPQELEAYLARRRDEGLTASSRNRILAAAKAIFKKAAEWGYVPHDPAATVKMEREAVKMPMPYTRDEVGRILEQLEPGHRRIAEIYLQTGLRLSELRRLRWADVDFESAALTVRGPKNLRDRVVPTSRRVFQILQELRGENRAARNRSLQVVGDKADILEPLNRAALRAGIDDGRRHRLQHRLRDTAATTMLDRGVPLDRVQAILGHRTLAMTRRYAETRDEHLRSAIAQAFDEPVQASGP